MNDSIERQLGSIRRGFAFEWDGANNRYGTGLFALKLRYPYAMLNGSYGLSPAVILGSRGDFIHLVSLCFGLGCKCRQEVGDYYVLDTMMTKRQLVIDLIDIPATAPSSLYIALHFQVGDYLVRSPLRDANVVGYFASR